MFNKYLVNFISPGRCSCFITFFFFFNDTATTVIYTLSLHDALPILERILNVCPDALIGAAHVLSPCSSVYGSKNGRARAQDVDRKSTRLNSSHSQISYAVFCLKKKIK